MKTKIKILWISNNPESKKPIEEKGSSLNWDITFFDERRARYHTRGSELADWTAIVVDEVSEVFDRSKIQQRAKKSHVLFKCHQPTSAIEDTLNEIYSQLGPLVEVQYEDTLNIIYDYWGEDSEATSRILKSILKKAHDEDPDSFVDIDKDYPQLRKLLQFTFKTCHHYGLLPDYCAPENLVQCACTLAGKPKIYYDKKEHDNRECLLPRRLREAVWSIIQAGNEESHTTGYLGSWMLLHSYTLKFCELIRWIGEFVSEHQNIEIENNAKVYEIQTSTEPQRIETDNLGFFHCGNIQLPANVKGNSEIVLQKVIMNVDLNTDYPYFALKYRTIS